MILCFQTEMDIFEEKRMRDKIQSGDLGTLFRPNLEETVTRTVVQKTQVSVVKMVQKEDEVMKEGCFGNLGEGLKVNCSENGASMVMDVEGSLGGNYENSVFEGKSGVEIFESKDDMNKNDDGDEEEEEDHDFVVGDFVWGKIKSHPWWPGQIYDPSDASDYAASFKRKGRLLVAYFGDGSFSWCSPSQLKPFVENFEKMSNQSGSKKFVNAVQEVLEEVSRRLEGELRCKCCKCQTVDATEKSENAGVVNRGIKEGVCVPKGNTIKVLMDRIEPVELVSTLKGYATMEPGKRLVDLEFILLKSCLSAFYTKNGGHLLAYYHDPKCIDGLEDETRSQVVGDSDVIGPSGGKQIGDQKLYQARKKKNVAELLGEDESKTKKAKMSKDGGMKKERKRKALVVSVTPESDHESDGGGVEEEAMSPRQRKKSRYLSPPYLSPVGSGRLSVFGSGTGIGSGSGLFKEPKTEPEKVSEMAAKQLEESLKSSGRKTREKRHAREGADSQDLKKTDAAVDVTNVLDGLLTAALDPSSFVEEEKSLPTITQLVSSFRGSVFKEEGSGNQSGIKKNGEETSVIGFIKQKLEWMNDMVHMCGESEMRADVKASLEQGIQEVLEKVVKMRGE
ncbi:hypothetical protein QVD17_09666 [Tagetes erecta]|uniref:PWWP domain-containing protein n=1 Tax=Tagetes erecta TaxID=13708 RepID=A0AAD8P5I1_TARER|nr:hypothetical protein QVD17_09666 [Tagetes erecta]